MEQKIDTEVIRQLIEMVEKNDLEELDVRYGNYRVYLKRGSSTAPVAVKVSPEPAAFFPESVAEEEAPVPENFLTVKAPLAGIFYRAPAPGAPPFIEVGSSVEPGHTLCIIEAMKMMNEIVSEVSGEIAAILIENATAVAAEQVLIHIKPS
ncbi:MAG: biotin/lipoyl-containing protein [Candidatus Eremiobacteraeota bacterium]|nr:biotin/lipoyl-containing protein [Candidatus Eremiobacteraeota bacterium]